MSTKIITQDRLKELLNYDPETGVFTWIKKSSKYANITVGDVCSCTDNDGYILIGIDRVLYKSHRLAWLYMTGKMPLQTVDHIDHSKGNNVWSNLRQASNKDQSRNISLPKRNKSGVLGVYWHPVGSKWRACIKVDGEQCHIGSFNCITAAAIARKAVEIKYGFHANHGA